MQRCLPTLLFILTLCTCAPASLLAQEVSTLVPRGQRSFEAISWSASGRIITPDFANGRLFEINRDGTLDTLVQGLRGPLGGTFDEAGNFYYAEFGFGRLRRYSPDGQDSIMATGLGQPAGTYYDAPNNRIMVSDYTFSRLLAVSLADGTVTTLVDSSEVSGLNGPDGIVPAHGGGYLIANFNDSLFHHLDTLGNLRFFARLPSSPNSGYLVPYRDGYLSAGAFGHQIWFITAAGEASVWAGNGVQAFVNGNRLDTVSFSIPNGIALSPDGDTLMISENSTFGQVRIVTGLNALTSTPVMSRQLPLFKLFPQPVQDSFTTTFSLAASARVTGRIFTLNGKQLHVYPVRQLPAGEQQENWQLPNLVAGAYLFQIITETGIRRTVRILIP